MTAGSLATICANSGATLAATAIATPALIVPALTAAISAWAIISGVAPLVASAEMTAPWIAVSLSALERVEKFEAEAAVRAADEITACNEATVGAAGVCAQTVA